MRRRGSLIARGIVRKYKNKKMFEKKTRRCKERSCNDCSIKKVCENYEQS